MSAKPTTASGRRRGACRAPTRSTSDRLTAAWQHSPTLARHATAAACATSCALVFSLRTTALVAGTTAVVGVVLALAALVDVHEHRLPNQLLATASLIMLGCVVVSRDALLLRDSLVGATLGGGLMLFVRLSRGVGMGDVKMACIVGASVGAVAQTLFAAPIAIALSALSAAVFGILTRRRRLALGPSLWFGWAAAITLLTSLPSNGRSS